MVKLYILYRLTASFLPLVIFKQKVHHWKWIGEFSTIVRPNICSPQFLQATLKLMGTNYSWWKFSRSTTRFMLAWNSRRLGFCLRWAAAGCLVGRQVDIRPTLEKCQAIKKTRNFLHLIFDEIIAMPIQ